MALVAANVIAGYARATGAPSAAMLIEDGRDWLNRHGLYTDVAALTPRDAEDLHLHVGYCIAVLGGRNPDLLIDAYEKLGVPYTLTVSKTGRTIVSRVQPEPEPEPTSEPPVTEVKGSRKRRREKLDAKVDLRLPSNERRELEAYARRKGLTVGQYARDLLAQGVWYDKAAVLEKQERDLRAELVRTTPREDVLTRFKRALKA